jgi:hypothetical protein
MTKPANLPSDHHYIPQFLLRQWAVNDGKLWRFTKPYGPKIAAKLVAPRGVGYETDLYTIPEVAPTDAQAIELGIMREVDDAAGKLMDILLWRKPWIWSVETKRDWSRFLLALMHRTPDSLINYKAAMDAVYCEIVPELRERYAELRLPTDPPTYEEYQAQRTSVDAEQTAFKLLPRSISNERVFTFLGAMEWRCMNVKEANRPLLITNEPLLITNGLGKPEGHLMQPIAPTVLFVAATRLDMMNRLFAQDRTALVGMINECLIERATTFVGAVDKREAALIEARFGTKPHGGVLGAVVRKYEETK